MVAEVLLGSVLASLAKLVGTLYIALIIANHTIQVSWMFQSFSALEKERSNRMALKP